MKQFLSIALVFFFLLPSIGLHIDMSQCCGSIENLGISHSAKIEISSCCHPQKSASCQEEKEIVQSPVYQDLASEGSFELQNAPIFDLPVKLNCQELLVSEITYQTPFFSFDNVRLKPSFLQVFLC